MKLFKYGEDILNCSLAMGIAQGRIKGVLSSESCIRINQSAEYVQHIVNQGKVVYGINTGFGPLCTNLISANDTAILQENILKSHAVGRGKPIDSELSKLMMILKVHTLSMGYSGLRLSTIQRIIWFIEEDLIPVVPNQGSVGASGDLAPLSHLFLPLIGLGKVWCKNELMATEEVLKMHGKLPIVLGAKEGLALINGTQFMSAHAVKAVVEMHRLLDNADLISAVMIEGLNGSIKPFLGEIHQLRPYKGNMKVAHTIFNLLKDSQILESHKNCTRVQDPYSMRCIPQVHGASRNAMIHFKEMIEIELNAVTDNPVIINDELTISGGSFHGQPIALPMDYATLAISEIGNISDRRVYLSLEGQTNGVPKLLMKSIGLNSGFMILQYCTAAIASENKGLCFPASADSIPTSLGQEDHVSMGSISGRKLLEVIDNVDKILSIELLCAAQAKDYHYPLKSTPIIEAIHQYIRTKIPHLEEDQPMEAFLDTALEIIKSGELIAIAESVRKELNLDTISWDVGYIEN